VLAVLAMSSTQVHAQTATVDDGSLGGYQEPGGGPPKARPQDATSKPWEAKPWETKPWEAAQEELRPGVKKSLEERRRVGRKARKERLENRNENLQPVGDIEEPVRERQNKWRRHQMESQRYYPVGIK
jgi:hypothetical protein